MSAFMRFPVAVQIDSLSDDVLSTITNHEFLRSSREMRLKSLTNPKIDANTIKTGDEITFRFSFKNGEINQDLYLNTTAGQLLPPSVYQVQL